MRANSGAMTLFIWRWASRPRRLPGPPGNARSKRSRASGSATPRLSVCPKLRERIARHLSERYGVGVGPERVVVTAGSSAGFVLAFLALAETALAHSDEAIVVNSFSKYFSMTGWRIGWLVVPEALVRPIERLSQNLYISPPAISQVAALGAFDGIEELEAIKAGYARNRAMLLEELPRAGLSSILPADVYLYADVSRFTADSEAFAKTMLKDIGVAVTPGIDFDPDRGRSYIRFCYAGAEARMREAARRINGWLKGK
jgi:aspartate/methionine/tyrosine aminotransferase